MLRARLAVSLFLPGRQLRHCKCELVLRRRARARAPPSTPCQPEERAKGRDPRASAPRSGTTTAVRRIDTEELVIAFPRESCAARGSRSRRLTHDIKGARARHRVPAGPVHLLRRPVCSARVRAGPSRHYSMAMPSRRSELVFHVRHMPGGSHQRTYVASQLKAGDRVKGLGPARRRVPSPSAIGRPGPARRRRIRARADSSPSCARCSPPAIARRSRSTFRGTQRARRSITSPCFDELAARHDQLPLSRRAVRAEGRARPPLWVGARSRGRGFWRGSPTPWPTWPVRRSWSKLRRRCSPRRGLAPRQMHADAFYNQG